VLPDNDKAEARVCAKCQINCAVCGKEITLRPLSEFGLCKPHYHNKAVPTTCALAVCGKLLPEEKMRITHTTQRDTFHKNCAKSLEIRRMRASKHEKPAHRESAAKRVRADE
jgi:hypothetical protein